MNRTKNIIMTVLLLGVAMVVLGFALDEQGGKNCEQFNVQFVGPSNLDFVRADEVRKRVQDRGDAIIGQDLATISTGAIEEDIRSIPHVRSVEVFKTIDRSLNVIIEQREPVFRFETDKGVSGYVDADGLLMPGRSGYAPRVIPVTGNLPFDNASLSRMDVREDSELLTLWQMVRYVNKSEFWRSQILQFHIQEDVLLAVPRVGNHRLILGDAQDYEKKLNRLMKFYEQGIEQTNWNIYESIDLRYDDQVVCKKRNI